MTDVPSKHVWKIKESFYVYTTINIERVLQNTPGETKKVENAAMYAVRMEINLYLNNAIIQY